VFVRTALEYQYWDINTGAIADSTSFVSDPAAGIGVTATSNTSNMLFDFIGFNLGAGIMY
jgi:hypothetical protein